MSVKAPSHYQQLGGILLVAGTAIGAGMLALPIATGVGGLGGITLLFLAGFLYMLSTLFVLLEAALYARKPEHNLISMTHDYLGLPGQITAWVVFLLLLYAVSTAYISGGASLMNAAWPTLFSTTSASMLFALIFGTLAFLGFRFMDMTNRILMLGLGITYICLIGSIAPHLDVAHLSGGMPQYLWAAVPIVVLSFTSHLILPSIRVQLNNHIPSLKRVLLLGSIVPIVCYLIWECLIIGILPFDGKPGLLQIAQSSDGLKLLATTLTAKSIPHVGFLNSSFSFFAMITSFLGVIISLFDFLADGLKWKKKGKKRVMLLLMTFIPPLSLAVLFPSFVTALNYAGVFVAILYGILPPCIVWHARYHLKLPQAEYTFPGGKFSLLLIMLLALAIIGLEVASANHWLPMP